MKIEEELYNVETQIQEFERLIIDVEDYSKIDDAEVLAPIANGIFVKTKKMPGNFVVNVGSGVVTEKTAEQVKEMLISQIKSLQEYRDELVRALEEKNVQISKGQD